MRVGLTGGIGSGKSTVAALLALSGACIIDADAIAQSVTAPAGAAIAPLKTAFGQAMLTKEGALDRARMRRLIYADAAAKGKLENIVHPLVQREMVRQTEQAEKDGARCIVLDIPLLLESKYWRKQLQRILVIDCSETTQIERVSRRDGLGAVEVQKILVAQASRVNRLQAADLIVFNDGISPEKLAEHVREISAQFGL